MANVVVIDDGTREYTIQNQFGAEICKVHFRPADFSIVDRYNAMMKDFDKIVEPLKDLSLRNDGTAAFDKDWVTLKKVESDVIEKIAGLFGMDDAKGIFAERNAFSSIGGEFYCSRVLNALQQAVTEAVEQEAKLSEKRMAKYLDDIPEAINAGKTAENA